jgi:hypothetical protein
MKKIVVIGFFFLLGSFGLFGVDVGISMFFNYNLMNKQDASQIDFNSLSDLAFIGTFVDVPLEKDAGLRVETGVRFSEVPDASVVGRYNKNIHWYSSAGPVIHPFGRGFIDPFAGIGIGSAGGVFFDQRALDWKTRVQLVVFFYGEAGINICLSDVLIAGVSIKGMFYSFNPSPLDTYDMFPVSGSLNVGFRL